MPKSTDKFNFHDDAQAAEKDYTSRDIQRRIETLRHSHHHHYRLMGLETWAIAETMDEFQPGFWNRFMINRQIATRDLIERKYPKRKPKLEESHQPANS